MALFNEDKTVRDFIRDTVQSPDFKFVPGHKLQRSESDVLLEGSLRDALVSH